MCVCACMHRCMQERKYGLPDSGFMKSCSPYSYTTVGSKGETFDLITYPGLISYPGEESYSNSPLWLRADCAGDFSPIGADLLFAALDTNLCDLTAGINNNQGRMSCIRLNKALPGLPAGNWLSSCNTISYSPAGDLLLPARSALAGTGPSNHRST